MALNKKKNSIKLSYLYYFLIIIKFEIKHLS